MAQPTKNDTVIFTFKAMLDNGEVFLSADADKPAKAVIGNSDLPPSIESELIMMQIGETRKIRVPPEEGYGQRLKELVQTIDNQQLIANLKPKPGMIISLKIAKDGVEQNVPATVMSVDGSKVTVDYNHPLAGHHLTYQITLIDKSGN